MIWRYQRDLTLPQNSEGKGKMVTVKWPGHKTCVGVMTGKEDIIWITKKMKTHIEICWTITAIALWVCFYNFCSTSLWRLCQLFCKSSLFKFNCLCTCRVCMSMYRAGHVYATCGGKRATGRGQFSLSTLWIPGMQFRSSGLYSRTLNY